mmetsp:Transcript_4354/g.11963  ORF Transcript_4354/g.11963 Transcript_4354/m.11963 type:complete len:209 (+) Transcript_4354:68-694(+)
MTSSFRHGVVQKLFHPAQHLWIQISPQATTTTKVPTRVTPAIVQSQHGLYLLEIGLTPRGLEDIGDLAAIQSAVFQPKLSTNHNEEEEEDPQRTIRRGDDLLTIEWQGHSITGADELYHTVWDSFEGRTQLKAPVSGRIRHVWGVGSHGSFSSADCSLDEDTVLAQLTGTAQDLAEACRQNELVNEKEYGRVVDTMPPGKFHEPIEVA